MFGSVILDVAVGLILVYLLLSLISASIREGFAGLLKTRSTTLHEGLIELLNDESLVAAVYDHPLLNALYHGETYAEAKQKKQLPSYIPAHNFALAMLDVIVRGRDATNARQAAAASPALTVENVRAQIATIGNARVQRAVLTALDAAQDDLDAFRSNIEQWFDSAMDRVSGWYKQRTQIWVFLVGLLLAVAVDADTLRIARILYTDPVQRDAVVAMATSVEQARAGTDSATRANGGMSPQQAFARLDTLGLPIGWHDSRIDAARTSAELWTAIFAHTRVAVLGWLLTALAVALGAPFWFDTLGRVMVVRSTVKPHQKSPDEASTDRQAAPAPRVYAAPVPPASPAPPAPPAPPAAPEPAPPPPPPPPLAPEAADFTPQEWATGHPDEGIV